MPKVLVLTKRQYMKKDLLDDRFGRFREIPLGLAEVGHSVQGLCLSYEDREEGLMRDGEVKWKSTNATRYMIPGLLRYIAQAAHHAKHANIIWACSDSIYGILGCLLGWRFGIPVIFDIYDNFEAFFFARMPFMKHLYKWAVRRVEGVTCFSKRMAERVESYGREKPIYILENTACMDLFKPMERIGCRELLGLPVKARIIGTAGALYRNRGVELLFDAFLRIQGAHEDVHLAVAGPREKDLQIPKHPKIHDLGILPHATIPRVINALDVAVVCYKDGELGEYSYPYKAREIMACNIPMIAAAVGSMKDVLHEHPQWLYDPDSVESLVNAIMLRFHDTTTDYPSIPTWLELARVLATIISEETRLYAHYSDPMKPLW